MEGKKWLCAILALALTLGMVVPDISKKAAHNTETLEADDIVEGRQEILEEKFDLEEENIKAVKDNNSGFHYRELIDGTLEITGYSGSETELVIPEEIDGKIVSRIGERAFENYDDICSATIPEGVTRIGAAAFFGCSSLTSVTIPEGVTSIEDEAFFGCSSLTSVTIPEGVIHIGDAAFSRCSSLAGVTIPRGVTWIGDYTFCDCSCLEYVVIPETVTGIGESGFQGCEKLTDVVLPEGITEIDSNAFSDCESLVSMIIPDGVDRIGDSAFSDCINLLEISLPKNISSIESGLFSGCSSLSSLYIPENITFIDIAFTGCSNLTSIEVDEKNESYESHDGILYWKSEGNLYSLSRCPEGKSGEITIPEGVLSIGIYAFSGCSNVTKIIVPESVRDMGICVFEDCSSLKCIEVDGDNMFYMAREGVLYDKEMKRLICCPGGKTGNVTVPENVEEIENNAFEGCKKLQSIEVSRNNEAYTSYEGIVYDKRMDKLLWCPGGKAGSITIPEGVDCIGGEAFYQCENLTGISIPGTVTNIVEAGTAIREYILFEGCSHLISIEVAENNTVYSSYRGMLYDKNREKLIRCPEGINGNAALPEGVTDIQGYAFKNCRGLVSLTVPESVTRIGEDFLGDGGDFITLVVVPGSYAESFAKKYDIQYSYGGGCIHTYVSRITKEASCTLEGIKTYTCTECRDTYIEFVPADHKLVTDQAVSATCLNSGKTEGIHCQLCYAIIKQQEMIPATGHNYKTIIAKAAPGKNGSIMESCERCGDVKSRNIIYAPASVTLAKVSYIYNGKSQYPSVLVKDSNGSTLKDKTDYTVSYSGNMKNVGRYVITVTLKGNYSGSLTKTVTITPKTTSISRIMPQKKGFIVKWKKQTKQTTGYRIEYSTSKKFTKNSTKSAEVSKNKTTSKSVKKLKAGKKYYVRIRTYKNAKVNGKTTKIYSGWSKVKGVTVKK